MSRAQIAERLGATRALSDPELMATLTHNLADELPRAQFLAVTSNHVQTHTDVSPRTSVQVAAALALPNGKQREQYLTAVTDRDTVDRCATALKFIDSLMNDSDRLALHTEICAAIGTVH